MHRFAPDTHRRAVQLVGLEGVEVVAAVVDHCGGDFVAAEVSRVAAEREMMPPSL